MKRGTPDHPKITDLMARLGVSRVVAVGALELLWHFTADYAKRGDVGRFTDEQIARGIGWEGDASGLIAGLAAAGWLDASKKHRFLVHDWPDHADDAVHVSLARGKTRFANGAVPKLTKLSLLERKEIEAHFCAHKERTKYRPPLPLPRPTPEPEPEPLPEPEPRPRAGAHGAPPAVPPTNGTAPDERDPGQLWETAKIRLSGVIPRHLFATYVRPLEVARWDGDTLVIELPPDQGFAKWHRQHREQVRAAFDALEYHGPIRFACRARDPAEVELHEGSVR